MSKKTNIKLLPCTKTNFVVALCTMTRIIKN